jgi:hypothetical protein
LLDQIFPEHTGIPKQPLAGPQSLLEVISYNVPNNTISAEFLLQFLNYTFQDRKAFRHLEGKEAERVRKRIFFRFFDSESSPDEVFRIISRLVKVHEIKLLVPKYVIEDMDSEDKMGSRVVQGTALRKTVENINQEVQPQTLGENRKPNQSRSSITDDMKDRRFNQTGSSDINDRL